MRQYYELVERNNQKYIITMGNDPEKNKHIIKLINRKLGIDDLIFILFYDTSERIDIFVYRIAKETNYNINIIWDDEIRKIFDDYTPIKYFMIDDSNVYELFNKINLSPYKKLLDRGNNPIKISSFENININDFIE